MLWNMQKARLQQRRLSLNSFCAERTKALEAREAAAAELEAMLKQQQAQSQQSSRWHACTGRSRSALCSKGG